MYVCGCVKLIYLEIIDNILEIHFTCVVFFLNTFWLFGVNMADGGQSAGHV